MLSFTGRTHCPRCDVKLVHEYDLANDWIPPAASAEADERWLCPRCGFSRPVVYALSRATRPMSRH
jgi:hypothetical protein